jgi:hypothetical protein
MHGLGVGFWWANVLICAYCTLYWARKRMGDGTPALMTPTGQVWAWQLIFSFIILALDASPWHLLWLGLVAIVLSMIVSNIYRRSMLAARYQDVGNESEQALKEDLQKESWIEHTAANYLTGDLNKNAFFSFIRESPALKRAFHDRWGETLTPERPLTRGRLTIIFNEAGVLLAKSGDPEGAIRSFGCSSLFIKGNPLTWAAIAEAACADEDRVALVWARKVTGFRLTESASPELQEFLSTAEAQSLLKDARRRMNGIVAICEMYPSWRDTSQLVEQVGTTSKYFDE